LEQLGRIHLKALEAAVRVGGEQGKPVRQPDRFAPERADGVPSNRFSAGGLRVKQLWVTAIVEEP
jgi:hypothetical protein